LLDSNERLRNTRDCFDFFHNTFIEKQFDGRFDDLEYAKSVFHNHIAEVKAYVPEENLLVFDAREGWGPLCNFLGVEVPSQEFPHANRGENFAKMLEMMISMAAKG
jgi:hypothetical protein